jgi:hypothetical protein
MYKRKDVWLCKAQGTKNKMRREKKREKISDAHLACVACLGIILYRYFGPSGLSFFSFFVVACIGALEGGFATDTSDGAGFFPP